MRIFLTGATGFIGRHLAVALQRRGHDVHCAVRNITTARAKLPGFELQEVDFGAADTRRWLSLLGDIDIVINAVGAFAETDRHSFATLHDQAPRRLFDACVEASVRRVIQISALGANSDSGEPFLESKHVADSALLSSPLDGVVLLPGPVFGSGGASARLFLRLATLPVVAFPVGGALQPVHIDDLCQSVIRLVDETSKEQTRVGRPQYGRIATVSSSPLAVQAYVATLRQALGYRPALAFTLPPALIRWLYALTRIDWLNPRTIALLENSRAADPQPFSALLGREPIAPRHFITDRQALLQFAWLDGGLKLLAWGLAILWVVSGVVSLGVFPEAESLHLLNRSGFHPPWGRPLLYGAAVLDIYFGVAILLQRHWRRLLWLAQAAVIVAYTAIIVGRLPEFLIHPYGPIVKNLPILTAIVLLYIFEAPDYREATPAPSRSTSKGR